MAGPGILQASARRCGEGSLRALGPATHVCTCAALPSNRAWGGVGRRPAGEATPGPGGSGTT